MAPLYRCQWVRRNNGIIQALFEGESSQPEIVLMNVAAGEIYEVGRDYHIAVTPADPVVSEEQAQE